MLLLASAFGAPAGGRGLSEATGLARLRAAELECPHGSDGVIVKMKADVSARTAEPTAALARKCNAGDEVTHSLARSPRSRQAQRRDAQFAPADVRCAPPLCVPGRPARPCPTRLRRGRTRSSRPSRPHCPARRRRGAPGGRDVGHRPHRRALGPRRHLRRQVHGRGHRGLHPRHRDPDLAHRLWRPRAGRLVGGLPDGAERVRFAVHLRGRHRLEHRLVFDHGTHCASTSVARSLAWPRRPRW